MAEELKKEAFLDQPKALCPTVDNLRLMLGEARNVLAMQPLTRFCLKEDQDIYYWLRKKLVETEPPQAHELRMVKKDETAFWARLEAIAAQDEGGASC